MGEVVNLDQFRKERARTAKKRRSARDRAKGAKANDERRRRPASRNKAFNDDRADHMPPDDDPSGTA